MPIVHVVCATLKPDAAEDAIDHAIDLGRALSSAEGVQHALLGRGGDRLVAVTWLDGREALEPFAASPMHMAFIMRGLAPCIRGMWSAAVETDAAPPSDVEAMWVFALPSADTLFEWQVRDLLQSVAALPGHAAAGPTVEERERYRAGGVVCLAASESSALDAALAAVRPAWDALGAPLVACKVEVIPLPPGADTRPPMTHAR